MKQPRRLLAEAIGAKTLQVTDLGRLTSEIAAYLLSEGRVAELEPLMRDVIAYRAQHGIVEADVVSAHELSPRVLDDAREILRDYYPDAKQVTVSAELNPDVVGGIRVAMPHEQLDLTIRSQLSTFKHQVMT